MFCPNCGSNDETAFNSFYDTYDEEPVVQCTDCGTYFKTHILNDDEIAELHGDFI